MVEIISKRGAGEPEPVEGETTPPPERSYVAPVPTRNPRKDGEYYDTCVNADCGKESDRIHKMGGSMGDGTGAKGEEYLDWSMFSCDRRQGGCGTLWANTTRQGAEMHEQRGMGDPKWLTRSATRSLSVPSEKFSSEYERIFGHP